MDDHARRVCARLVQAWTAFEKNDAVSLLDLSRLANSGSGALDNATAPLPRSLRAAACPVTELVAHKDESMDGLIR